MVYTLLSISVPRGRQFKPARPDQLSLLLHLQLIPDYHLCSLQSSFFTPASCHYCPSLPLRHNHSALLLAKRRREELKSCRSNQMEVVRVH